MKLYAKIIAAITAALLWFWIVVIKVPVLLTSGIAGAYFGLTLLAVSVAVPVHLLVRFINKRRKPTKE